MASVAPVITIDQAARFEGRTVLLRGWLHNLRRSGKLLFPIFRDGTGYMQGVVVKADVPEEIFQRCRRLTHESAAEVRGKIRAEQRAPGGYEMDVVDLEVVQEVSPDDLFPITPKEHGVES